MYSKSIQKLPKYGLLTGVIYINTLYTHRDTSINWSNLIVFMSISVDTIILFLLV